MVNFCKKQFTLLSVTAGRFFQTKYWIFFGMTWVITNHLTHNIIIFSEITAEKTTPAIYAFIQSSPLFFLFYLLGVLCLFSDVPFCGRDQLYVLLREGRKAWYRRQMLYLSFGSFIAILTAISVCMLQLHSCLKLSSRWDRILGTLAHTDAGVQFRISFGVSRRILAHYTPTETFLQAFLIGWGVTLFLGVFMFAISLCLSRKAALLIASAMVLMCSLHDYYPSWMHYASPVSWINTTALGMAYMDHAPGLTYVCLMLPTVIILLIIISYNMMQKKDLDWTEEH